MGETSVFETLNKVNVNDYTEELDKKNYLSWPYAWAEVMKRYPEAWYEIHKFEGGLPYVYDEKTGYMVFTTVHIAGDSHDMWLPVLDSKFKAMKAEPYEYETTGWQNGQKCRVKKMVEAATMFDINKTIMRCLVKNLAMFGLGLYIYAGEDFPECDKEQEPEKQETKKLEQAPDDRFITAAEKVELLKEMNRTGMKKEELLNWAKIESVDDLTLTRYEKAMKQLKGMKDADNSQGT